MSERPFYEYVRFSLVGSDRRAVEERLNHLRSAVRALSEAKAVTPSGQAEPQSDDDLYSWRCILPPMALATFHERPPEGAWLPPSGLIEPEWDELSMLAVILASETELRGIHLIEDKVAELRFVALAWPYGGITCLIRLVEAFGFDIVCYDEGSLSEVSRAQHLRSQLA